MLGKKNYQEKLFHSFQLSQRIPKENFYRRLKEVLDLSYLYRTVEPFYGREGQKSIDPIVFFKLMLVGYLENIISDRQLIEHTSMRMDILYFLGYDIDEPFPWHSTLSRTRQLLPESLFEQVFEKILQMCIEKGMVSGHTQAIDSALIKANASMDSLELKVPAESLQEHLEKVRVMSTADRRAKENRADKSQQIITADTKKLQDINTRQKKWAKDQDQRPGAGNKGSKYTSNYTHYSPTDPDARISVKPGKPRKLNYLSQLATDTGHHVITHISADFADKKDNQCLQQIVEKLYPRLQKNDLLWTNLPADAGYSSGENYAYMEEKGLQSFIPPHGTYKGGPEGFTYVEEGDYWECAKGEKVTYRKTKIEKGTLKRYYFTRRKDCSKCPIKVKCIGKSHEKRIGITAYKEEYDRAIERVNSRLGRQMKKKRQSTVEPVFGTLINHMGLRKINTRGIEQANKVMLMAATAYNLKKYLKFTKNLSQSMAIKAKIALFYFCAIIRIKISRFKASKFPELRFQP